jgi:hypothetical protein
MSKCLFQHSTRVASLAREMPLSYDFVMNHKLKSITQTLIVLLAVDARPS